MNGQISKIKSKTKPKMNRKSDTSVILGCSLVFLLGNQQEKGGEPSTNHWRSQTIKFCNRKYLIHVACDAGPCCFETPSHLNPRKNTQWPEGLSLSKDCLALELSCPLPLCGLNPIRTHPAATLRLLMMREKGPDRSEQPGGSLADFILILFCSSLWNWTPKYSQS